MFFSGFSGEVFVKFEVVSFVLVVKFLVVYGYCSVVPISVSPYC